MRESARGPARQTVASTEAGQRWYGRPAHMALSVRSHVRMRRSIRAKGVPRQWSTSACWAGKAWTDMATMEKCYDLPDDADVLAVTG
jgi:hypothetical protein